MQLLQRLQSTALFIEIDLKVAKHNGGETEAVLKKLSENFNCGHGHIMVKLDASGVNKNCHDDSYLRPRKQRIKASSWEALI